MITGLEGKGKKTYRWLYLGLGCCSLMLLRVTWQVMTYTALSLFTSHPSQTAPNPFHVHCVMGMLALNKTNRRNKKKEKKQQNCRPQFAWENHQKTQWWHHTLGFTAHFPQPLCISTFSAREKPLWAQTLGCVGRRHGCFLLLIFLSTPCWPGISHRAFKKLFPFRICSTSSFWSVWTPCSRQTQTSFYFRHSASAASSQLLPHFFS